MQEESVSAESDEISNSETNDIECEGAKELDKYYMAAVKRCWKKLRMSKFKYSENIPSS